MNRIPLVTGDTITLNAANYVLDPSLDFNPQVTQTFAGNMFFISESGNLLSNVVAVPEPSSTALLVLGAAAVCAVVRRRRK